MRFFGRKESRSPMFELSIIATSAAITQWVSIMDDRFIHPRHDDDDPCHRCVVMNAARFLAHTIALLLNQGCLLTLVALRLRL